MSHGLNRLHRYGEHGWEYLLSDFLTKLEDDTEEFGYLEQPIMVPANVLMGILLKLDALENSVDNKEDRKDPGDYY